MNKYYLSQALRVVHRPEVHLQPLAVDWQDKIDNSDPELMIESLSLEQLEQTGYGEGYLQLEAVTSTKSRLPKTMAALGRELNKALVGRELETSIADIEISKVRKTAGLAVMTARIPLSDGQSIGVVFHSPDEDPSKITETDELIAFRFLLNRADVTNAVSPLNGRDISLKQLTNNLATLAEKNKEKFAANAAKSAANKAEIESALTELDATNEAQEAAQAKIDALTDEIQSLGDKVKLRTKTLTKKNDEIKRLEDELASIRANTPAPSENGGSGNSEASEGQYKYFDYSKENTVKVKVGELRNLVFSIETTINRWNGGTSDEFAAQDHSERLIENTNKLISYYSARQTERDLDSKQRAIGYAGDILDKWHQARESKAQEQANYDANAPLAIKKIDKLEVDWGNASRNDREYNKELRGRFKELTDDVKRWGGNWYLVLKGLESRFGGEVKRGFDEARESYYKWAKSQEEASKPVETTGEANHFYGLRARPMSVGAIPDGQTAWLNPDQTKAKFPTVKPDNYRHGAVGYERALTKEQVNQYELIDLFASEDIEKTLKEAEDALNALNSSGNLFTTSSEYQAFDEAMTELGRLEDDSGYDLSQNQEKRIMELKYQQSETFDFPSEASSNDLPKFDYFDYSQQDTQKVLKAETERRLFNINDTVSDWMQDSDEDFTRQNRTFWLAEEVGELIDSIMPNAELQRQRREAIEYAANAISRYKNLIAKEQKNKAESAEGQKAKEINDRAEQALNDLQASGKKYKASAEYQALAAIMPDVLEGYSGDAGRRENLRRVFLKEAFEAMDGWPQGEELPETETSIEVDQALADLDRLNGSDGDSMSIEEFEQLLDEAANVIEEAELFDQYEGAFNQAADKLTLKLSEAQTATLQ